MSPSITPTRSSARELGHDAPTAWGVLPVPGRGHDVEPEDAAGVELGAVEASELVVRLGDGLYDWHSNAHMDVLDSVAGSPPGVASSGVSMSIASRQHSCPWVMRTRRSQAGQSYPKSFALRG